ncbi:uncharacterized protein TA08305 [Theileria annulata]|uniref:Uncharacterized protein n=1 Tax=Theileria annulata TaxID=5874 RepID=Q4U9Q1_THEAN|nr:uncharacterized protein TA08305 [Theileria annulata]CAI76452.1 hypothetical protein, conserved [Theileria annulata]|eukprot:XP_953077.1 hypothetical protein, conserved [Theileria annulata]
MKVKLVEKLSKRFGTRLFSTQPMTNGLQANEGLYDRTARPLENLVLDNTVTTYSEGLKSCRIFDNPNIIRVIKKDKEGFFDRLYRYKLLNYIFMLMWYRYLDIGGLLTIVNSRKAHLLRVPPEGRISLMLLTEFERKQGIFINFFFSFLLTYICFCYIRHKIHIYDRRPSPDTPIYEFTNNRTRDFTWHGSFPFQYPKGRCKECRWLELECKKRCYDDLLRQGHKFIIHNPMQIPRRTLLPSPYPPIE